MPDPLAAFLPALRKHPGLYVPWLSYMSVCVFISGYRWGSDDTSLAEFQSWLAARGSRRPELGWVGQVLWELYPGEELPDMRRFTEAEDHAAMNMLFDLLEEFYKDGVPHIQEG